MRTRAWWPSPTSATSAASTSRAGSISVTRTTTAACIRPRKNCSPANANGEAPHTCAAAGGPGWSDLEPTGSPDGIPEGDAAECRHLWWPSSQPEAVAHLGFCFVFSFYDGFPTCGNVPEGGAQEQGCVPYAGSFARSFRIARALFHLATHTASPALTARP